MISCRLEIYDYIKERYGATPEYLWARFPDYAVFRHGDNRKWFALLMNISKQKLGSYPDEAVDILNVKLSNPHEAEYYMQQDGIFKGYHISRGNWVSVLLDGSVPWNTVTELLAQSYAVTSAQRK